MTITGRELDEKLKPKSEREKEVGALTAAAFGRQSQRLSCSPENRSPGRETPA